MKLNFKIVPEELQSGLNRIGELLCFELSQEGIEMEATKAVGPGASLKDGKGTIYYGQKAHFFRALGLFLENARKGSDFHVMETPGFDTLGLMLDASRNGVMTVAAIKKYMDYLVTMGYNMLMMYTEDTFTVDNRPYFGYMRGRYAQEELKELDDYAYEYGIEMIPCIEAYSHMEKYLKWPVTNNIKDTERILLADEPATYELIDDMIRCAAAPFRSKRIHIGMDEAQGMGRGIYMDKHGYRDPFEIFNRHMDKVINITNKYGLIPMMWSDMYFRINCEDHEYYGKDTIVPEHVRAQIPEEVQLVYWHYSEGPEGCDDYMLKKHNELDRDIIFAGGMWSWIGHFPENNFIFQGTQKSVKACRDHGVREMMTTLWANDGHEINPFSCLLALSFTAEMAYRDSFDDKHLKSRFETCTKGSWEHFWAMSEYHNVFDSGKEYDNFHKRFAGKALFWQDVLEGLYDWLLFETPMSGHYKKYADIMRTGAGDFEWLYKHAAAAFDYLSAKTLVAENLKPAYDSGDKEKLAHIAKELLPDLIKKTRTLHEIHKGLWFDSLKGHGWAHQDIRYAGVAARAQTAIDRIEDYLSGKIQAIEELAAERLHYPTGGFAPYSMIATPNLKI